MNWMAWRRWYCVAVAVRVGRRLGWRRVTVKTARTGTVYVEGHRGGRSWSLRIADHKPRKAHRKRYRKLTASWVDITGWGWRRHLADWAWACRLDAAATVEASGTADVGGMASHGP